MGVLVLFGLGNGFFSLRKTRASNAERRRPGSARVSHSALFGRLCLTLLIGPWIIILALKNIFVVNELSPSIFFFLLFLELAAITLVGLTLANGRVKDLRSYEAQREHERLLFSYARDGMLLLRVHDRPDARSAGLSFVIQAENPTAVARLRSIGQEDSYVGRDVDGVFPKWLRQILRQEYIACVTSQKTRRYEVWHPNGTLSHESIATPIVDPVRNVVTHIIVIMRDIGDRIKHERQMAEALKKAEAANKSKSEFLASMSHELRTPLNAILGFSEAMAAGIGGALSEKQKEYASHIHQSGSHLLSIISDILDLSKIEAGQVILQERPVDVVPLMESCLLMVRERAVGKKLKLVMTASPNIPVLKADELRLKQILINLLSNAIKFTDSGSVILSAEFQAAKGFDFSVTDTGIGMTEAETAIALQPFGQVEGAFSRNHDGTGLGLPITSHLVALHSGKLSISSTPGLGTLATVTLPAARAVPPDQGKKIDRQLRLEGPTLIRAGIGT